jgi:UDP-N-acetylglucosamine 2-epimerase (non-hydrolysing)
MQKNQSLNQLSSRILASIHAVLLDFKPDYVLVHGDTTTSSMVALAAFHEGIKVGHVEAGLRTYNKFSPFPEELNRQITSRIADIHFAPTKWAAANLLAEKIAPKDIVTTGNTVIDALFFGLEKVDNGYSGRDIDYVKSIVDNQKKIILITGHRRENFGDGFEQLCVAIKEIATDKSLQIIYPVHLNPNVQEPVNRILSDIENVKLINPADYPAFIYLMKKAHIIITDSGGVQEEAPSLGKPVLLMRETTERPEAIDAGTVILVGTDKEKIVSNCKRLLADETLYSKMSKSHNPYGDGNASIFIANYFKELT